MTNENNKKFLFDGRRHRYTLDGKPLTGVTTILNVINKPALVGWAARMAADYVEVNLKDMKDLEEVCKKATKAHARTRDGAGNVGTKVHKIIEDYVNGIDPKEALEKLSEEQREVMEPMVKNFTNWAEKNKVKFLESEQKMYHEELAIAGTVDLVFEIDGKKYVGDIKTNAKIWDRTPFFQCAGYRYMLEHRGFDKFSGSCIIRLGKDGTWEEKYSYDYETDLKGFMSCLDLYRSLGTF